MNNEYKNLGLMNLWKKNPPEFDKCKELGHQPQESNGIWTCYNYVKCEICKIRWEYDSSD